MAWCPLELGENPPINVGDGDQKKGDGDQNRNRSLSEQLPEQASGTMRSRGRMGSIPEVFVTEAFTSINGKKPEKYQSHAGFENIRGQSDVFPGFSNSTVSVVPATARVLGTGKTASKSRDISFSFGGFYSREAFSPKPLGKGSKVVRGEYRGVGDVISEDNCNHKSATVAGGELRKVVQGISSEDGVTIIREWRENIETTAAVPAVKQEGKRSISRLTHGAKEHGARVKDGSDAGWRGSWRGLLGWTGSGRSLEGDDDPGRVIRFAWIPGDPCSCAIEEEGAVGEGCRAWLEARAMPLAPNAEVRMP